MSINVQYVVLRIFIFFRFYSGELAVSLTAVTHNVAPTYSGVNSSHPAPSLTM